MTDETSQTTDEQIPQTFGKRLKSAREDLRLELKDVASQLRLRVSIIEMLEKEMYSDDTPTTFLRGYLRSYAKFLEIPESELNSALSVEPFQPKIEPELEEGAEQSAEYKNMNKILGYADKTMGGFLNKNTYTIISTSSKYSFKSVSYLFRFLKRYFMPLFTGVIIFTLGYLVVTWWNYHKNPSMIMPPIIESMTNTAATVDDTNAVTTAAVDTNTAASADSALPTDAEDQDLEASLDDEPAIFEEDTAPREQSGIKQNAVSKKPTQLSMNQPKKVIDVYNE